MTVSFPSMLSWREPGRKHILVYFEVIKETCMVAAISVLLWEQKCPYEVSEAKWASVQGPVDTV